MRTLTIDIGGTGIKLLPVDDSGKALTERHRELTPRPATPEAVLEVIATMIATQEPFDRVTVGFPGVVHHGVVRTAPNLGTEAWQGFELESAIREISGKPTRVLNDAELQGYGVIKGKGVEIVLTLGTGLGTGLYVDGHLVPNLELGHHPLRKNKTYEELVGNAELDRIGKKKWRKRVAMIIETLERIFNFDTLHIGGGNAKKLKGPFPDNVQLFTNVDGLAGGIRPWQDNGT
jgi:polyphosphate glucokinase